MKQLMNLTLKRKINIEVFRVKLNILVQQPAGMFKNYIQLTAEHGFLNQDLLVEKFQLNYPMADRAIKRCQFYDLIKPNSSDENLFVLDKLGKQMLKDSMIFRKEEGEFRIFITQDPLITQKILSIQRVNTIERADRRNKKREKIKTHDKPGKKLKLNIDNIQLQNIIIGNLEEENGFINSSEIIIEKCDEYLIQEEIKDTDLNLVAQINPKGRRLKLQGFLAKEQIDTSLHIIPADFSFYPIFRELFDKMGIFQNWDTELRAYKEVFNKEAKNRNYEDFSETFLIPDPSTLLFGSFAKTELSLPIIPRTEEDLINWEKYLLIEKITRIIDPKEYRDIKNQIENLMIEKCGHSIELPSQNVTTLELLKEVQISENIYGPRSKKYWYLQIPLDLSQSTNIF